MTFYVSFCVVNPSNLIHNSLFIVYQFTKKKIIPIFVIVSLPKKHGSNKLKYFSI